jgi:intracellular sulfur oxidation DsrE/DsrF family protein
MTKRREFIARMGAVAAGVTLDPEELLASARTTDGPWDTAWIDRMTSGKYRVVFNTTDIADGAILNYAGSFFDHFKEVHSTKDSELRAVSVFRRLGTSMAFNDVIWERYKLGEDRKITDPTTKAPALRNIYLKGLQEMHARGMISVVCNVSVGSISRSLAEATKRDFEEIRSELNANLVPGATLVPSGIFALIRAQNAGCAFMAGV